MLNRTFRYFDVDLAKLLYCAFVRPQLEFTMSAWCAYQAGVIYKLERVQQRATKLAPAKNLSYEERLKMSGLTTLEKRRERVDLIQLYKAVNGLDKINWTSTSSLQQETPLDHGVITHGHSLK
jgi:hypothetical protein